ncbi:DeoR/GlpR family DNA-binding transcription regulator [Amedibacterium intestinale]|uniref:DeoR/GlpR family DNA-binding transcription regulator n=1 Tax=Amedibacterium intestinale TaxID=2583452 RepID=UPI000E204351
MNFEERKDLILKELNKKGKLSFHDIEKIVDVAPTTIRRDLTILNQEGLVKRFHGGIKLDNGVSEFSMRQKQSMHTEEKKLLGKKAASSIQPNELIFIGSGSSTMSMIEFMDDKSVSVITNGIPHAEALHKKGIRTFLLCGFLKEHTRSLVGKETVQLMSNYKFDRCFIGANGISSNLDLLSADFLEHDIKNAAITNSIKSFVLVDSSKFNTTAMYSIPLRDHPNMFLITDDKTHTSSQIIDV